MALWRVLRTVVVFLVLAWLTPSTALAQAQITVNDQAPPDPVTIEAGATVVVAIASGPGSTTDWIAMTPSAAADGAYTDWRYLNDATVPPATGLVNATVHFTMPVVPGDYEFRLYANDGYTRLATSTTVTIVASASILTVNGIDRPTAVSAGAGTSLTVDVADGPGNATDWVAFYPAGAADAAYLSWRYLNGAQTQPPSGLETAELAFQAPTSAGSYEFRFFAAGSFARLTTSTTVVIDASAAQLDVNNVAPPTGVSVPAGSVAVVSVSSGPANRGDWVTFALAGSPDNSYVDWRYLSNTTMEPLVGASAATLTFTMPVTAGTYEFRFFASNGFGRLATSATVAVLAPPTEIMVNGVLPPAPVAVLADTTISVHVSGGPANATDWIALAATGAPNGSYLAWAYLNGLTSPPAQGVATADLSFAAPSTAGTYEFRLFANNGSGRLATSSTITSSLASVQVAITSPTEGTSP